MFCTNCGKEIPDNSKFCKYCGSKIMKNESTEQIQEAKTTDPTKKTLKVTFHRRKKFTGCLVPMYIYVDKKLVATLKNNEIFETYVTSGTHKIIVEMWSAVSESQVEFSEEYTKMYIEVGIKMGLITNKAQITSIRSEK